MKKSSKLIKIRFLQQNIFLKVLRKKVVQKCAIPVVKGLIILKNQYVSGIVKYDLLFYMI